jgi:hypothetical protein
MDGMDIGLKILLQKNTKIGVLKIRLLLHEMVFNHITQFF